MTGHTFSSAIWDTQFQRLILAFPQVIEHLDKLRVTLDTFRNHRGAELEVIVRTAEPDRADHRLTQMVNHILRTKHVFPTIADFIEASREVSQPGVPDWPTPQRVGVPSEPKKLSAILPSTLTGQRSGKGSLSEAPDDA